GVPVYFHGMTAQAKAIIDRTISLGRPERSLANKVLGVVASAGSLGLIQVLKDLTYFAHVKYMLPANHVAAYPERDTGIERMPGCRQDLRDLGKQMVALVELGFRYPPEFIKGPSTFGTHTW
ncbi:MAG: flavodoxin family protein, partial [Thermoleophilia bacterium]|nr:flavodoxin family protein [Thermoleophilia bacterium]